MTLEHPVLANGIIRFSTFELNVAAGELRKRGIRIALQEQPRQILVALLERPGHIVAREELCRKLWPEGTFVDFDHSLNAAVRRLRNALGDDADAPRFVETVQRRGYRFVALNPLLPEPVVEPARTAPAAIRRSLRKRSRLAVLPFGPYDGFTDGLTAEAIAQLTQLCPRTVGVIARASVERVQREGAGAAQIARALDADYLVEGHVRRASNRVRVTAHLVEARAETNMWARAFDRVMTDELTVQSDVGQEIARAVSHALASKRARV